MNMDRGTFLGSVLRSRYVKDVTLIETVYSANQILAEHSHERAFVSVLLRGSYTESYGLTVCNCEVGQSIFHVPGECHADRFHAQGGRLLNLELSPQLCSRLNDLGVRTDVGTASSRPECLQLVCRIHNELSCPDAISELAIEGMVMELLAALLRPRVAARSRESNWLDKVVQILRDRYRESLTLNDLASAVFIHPVHLARAFRKHHSCSVGEYVRKLRIEAACNQLSNSDTSLAEIAADTGFADQSHLSRTLKRYTGLSPCQFRTQRSLKKGTFKYNEDKSQVICSRHNEITSDPSDNYVTESGSALDHG